MNRGNEETWVSHSEAETTRYGEKFAERFVREKTVTCVRGELGAGKTHFIKGIARWLGIDEKELTSPTFALAHEFELPASRTQNDMNRPTRLFHLDCYRFEKPAELLQLGIEDYLYPQHAATIIEWPERIEGFIPSTALMVDISIISENDRKITVHPE